MDSGKRRNLVICSCERTMPAYGESVTRGCNGVHIEAGDHFCGAEMERMRTLFGGPDPVTIGCPQQAPLFRELADEHGFTGDLSFATLPDAARWADDSAGSEAGRVG